MAASFSGAAFFSRFSNISQSNSFHYPTLVFPGQQAFPWLFFAIFLTGSLGILYEALIQVSNFWSGH
jgi:hypothetical protein